MSPLLGDLFNPKEKINSNTAIPNMSKILEVKKSDPTPKTNFEIKMDGDETWQGEDLDDQTSGGREFLRKEREKKLLRQWGGPENESKDLERREDRKAIIKYILNRRSRHHRPKHSNKHKKAKKHKRKSLKHEVKSKLHKYDKYMKKLDNKYFHEKGPTKKHKSHHKKKNKHKKHGKKHKDIRKTFHGLRLNSGELNNVPEFKDKGLALDF